MRKKNGCSLLAMVMLFVLLLTGAAAAADATGTAYFKAQLLSEDARTIYAAFDGMDLTSGTDTVTLTGVQTGNWKALFADFIAARDAYMMDHNLFYVDFDKMTLSQSGNTVTLGVGRESTYFHDGFKADNVDAAIAAFNSAVTRIADEAMRKTSLQDRVKAAYDAVIAGCSYALEADVKKPGNELYVRIPYGALVTGEAVCEGYARAMKAVLDKMGVENVLVQGTYDDGTYKGAHMWNYVRMDDNRWYMLDATMEDGLRESTADAKTESFFLITGLDALMDDYQPYNVVSLSSVSMDFGYPVLSIKAYEDLSAAFELLEGGSVSYRGMGIAKAQATMKDGKPIYLLSSINGSTWYYYERFMQAMVANMQSVDPRGVSLKDLGLDTEASFSNPNSHAYFGITTIAPEKDYEMGKLDAYYMFEGGLENVHEVSQVGEAVDFEKAPPYITQKIPYNSRLDQGKTYEIEVTYSEPLKKVNSEQAVKLAWVREVNGASFADFKWWGDDANQPNPAKVTFTLTTGTNFGRTTNYYLELQNLVGKESNKAPNAIGFSTYNNNTYECPRFDGDVSKIHANTPVLIADKDLSTDDWEDAYGNSLKGLPLYLSLVATPIEDREGDAAQSEMIEAIEKAFGGNEVLGAQTFDISLSLCSNQVGFLKGKPVEVYVPFPEGYNAESEGVEFKAYHFDKKGNPEEIECEVVEGGIIMYCTRFSPFAVVAVKETAVNYVVTVAPDSASVEQGSKLQFTAAVDGDSGNAVTWRVSGQASEETAIDVNGLLTVAVDETAEEITVTATAVLDATKSAAATVTVVSIVPTIVYPTQPQNVPVYEGGKATMAVEAQNAASYQWYVAQDANAGFVPLSGATEASYTVDAVKKSQDGYRYCCVAINAKGAKSALSPVFTLEVTAMPTVPQTGDSSRIGLWGAILLFSVAAAQMIWRRRAMKNER